MIRAEIALDYLLTVVTRSYFMSNEEILHMKEKIQDFDEDLGIKTALSNLFDAFIENNRED